MLQPTDNLSVTLEARQWEQVLSLLHDVAAPLRITGPLVNAISTQCMRPRTAELHELPMRVGGGVQQAPTEEE